MKINVAKTAGFCFGVKRAIDIALRTAKLEEKVEMLGDIVHNEKVIKDIENIGIKKVNKITKGKDKTLLIRAHGVSLKTISKAKRLGYKIIDATCPMVKDIHRIATGIEEKGYRIIIIGDKKHDEVQGIIGHLENKPLVIDNLKNITFKKIKKSKRWGVVVQSTQNIEKVDQIFKTLKNRIQDLKLFNTICSTTRAKQQEISRLPLKNDVMIIIGSKKSANTKRLYEISKSLNKNSFWVQSKNDLRRIWFKKAKNVGVHAGASTPDYTTKEVVKHIRKLVRH